LGVADVALSPSVEWYPKARTLFLKVRDVWQLLFLESESASIIKAEIYAPHVPTLLDTPEVKQFFGDLTMIVLNPAASLASSAGLKAVEAATRVNCDKRGDDPGEVANRVTSVRAEAAGWREMIDRGAVEFADWGFPEWKHAERPTGTLVAARNNLVDRCPELDRFFMSEQQIRAAMPEPESTVPVDSGSETF
jgi:hypothetical protein